MTSRIINDLKVSQNGIDFIKAEEGLRLKVYKDIAGYSTIGYGHKLTKREVGKLNVITKAEAETLFMGDIWMPTMFINATVRVPLTQNQFDALASWIFNFGVGRFDRSTLLKVLQQGDFKAAANEILKWNKYFDQDEQIYKVDKRLDARRKREYALFNKVETEGI